MLRRRRRKHYVGELEAVNVDIMVGTTLVFRLFIDSVVGFVSVLVIGFVLREFLVFK